MSGYSSRADAQAVVRQTIESRSVHGRPAGLPHYVKAYNMAGIFADVISSRGSSYGYGIEYDPTAFWAAVRANLRPRYELALAEAERRYITKTPSADAADGFNTFTNGIAMEDFMAGVMFA